MTRSIEPVFGREERDLPTAAAAGGRHLVLCVYNAVTWTEGREFTAAKMVAVDRPDQVWGAFEAAMRAEDKARARGFIGETLATWEMVAWLPRCGRATF